MIVRTWRKDSGERLPPLGGSELHVHVLTLLVMSVGRSGRADHCLPKPWRATVSSLVGRLEIQKIFTILTVAEGRTPGCGAACHDANRSINGVPSIVLRNPLRLSSSTLLKGRSIAAA